MNDIIFGRSRKNGEGVSSRTVPVPDQVRAGLSLARRERILAAATDDNTGDWVLVTTWHIVVATPEGRVRLRRPWHLVDAGTWGQETYTLTVSWVDGHRTAQWTFRTATGPGLVPQGFRERVQASVVLTRHVQTGPRQHARVIIRTDLATRELTEQVLLGKAVDAGDPELLEALAQARAEVRDQVGLAPPAAGE